MYIYISTDVYFNGWQNFHRGERLIGHFAVEQILGPRRQASRALNTCISPSMFLDLLEMFVWKRVFPIQMNNHSAESMVRHLVDWAKELVNLILARFEHPARFVFEFWVALAQNKWPGPLGAKHRSRSGNKQDDMAWNRDSNLNWLTQATFSKFHFII